MDVIVLMVFILDDIFYPSIAIVGMRRQSSSAVQTSTATTWRSSSIPWQAVGASGAERTPAPSLAIPAASSAVPEAWTSAAKVSRWALPMQQSYERD